MRVVGSAVVLQLVSLMLVWSVPQAQSAAEEAALSSQGVQCHQPGRLSASLTKTPKFIEYSCRVGDKRSSCALKVPGMGNVLQVFPAVYLMAALTGRELIIRDDGGLGRVCSALKCGFDFTSKAEELFPELKKTAWIPRYLAQDIASKLMMNESIPEEVFGYQGTNPSANKAFLSAGPMAAPCIENVTGCRADQMGCVERFAFQQLFPGGFVEGVRPSTVVGLRSEDLEAILTSPYRLSPRFDAGVHIRAATSVLEKASKRNYTQLADDMAHYRVVFHHFAKALSHHFFVRDKAKFNISDASATGLWPRIFISCDDVDIRDAFVSFIVNRTSDKGRFIPVYVNASEIKLMKHMRKFSDGSSDFQVIVDTAFDWYGLSLSDACFGWRIGYSSMTSTFMQSASRVSLWKRTAEDFKSKVLRKHGNWLNALDYMDDLNRTDSRLSL